MSDWPLGGFEYEEDAQWHSLKQAMSPGQRAIAERIERMTSEELANMCKEYEQDGGVGRYESELFLQIYAQWSRIYS